MVAQAPGIVVFELGISITYSLTTIKKFLQWFRSEPEQYKQRDIQLYTSLVNDVKTRMAEGKCPDCLTSQTLTEEGFAPGSEHRRKNEKIRFDELDVDYTVASPFGAGIETVSGWQVS